MVIFNKQYRYAMNFDLGFTEENILDIDLYQVNPDVVVNAGGTLGHGDDDVLLGTGLARHGTTTGSVASEPGTVNA